MSIGKQAMRAAGVCRQQRVVRTVVVVKPGQVVVTGSGLYRTEVKLNLRFTGPFQPVIRPPPSDPISHPCGTEPRTSY